MEDDPYDGRKPGMFRTWREAAPVLIFIAGCWVVILWGVFR